MPELTTVVALTLRYQRASPAPVSDAPIFALAPERRAWGSDCVFVSAPTIMLQTALSAAVDAARSPAPPGKQR